MITHKRVAWYMIFKSIFLLLTIFTNLRTYVCKKLQVFISYYIYIKQLLIVLKIVKTFVDLQIKVFNLILMVNLLPKENFYGISIQY